MNLALVNVREGGKKSPSHRRRIVAEFVVPSVPELPEPTHIDPYLIAHCGFCDDDGYRNNRVCDHVDRTRINAEGLAKVREALQKRRAS
jgi:hypothetical protein